MDEMIKKLNDMIIQYDKNLDFIVEQFNDLKKLFESIKQEQQEESKNSIRKLKDEKYYAIRLHENNIIVEYEESNDYFDNICYKNNNYFPTHERAAEVLNKIELLLRLERLHDELCPNYQPDWGNKAGHKYLVYYNYLKKQFEVRSYCWSNYVSTVCFPTNKIAQKVCDILNSENENP